jgi:hypothetical protein
MRCAVRATVIARTGAISSTRSTCPREEVRVIAREIEQADVEAAEDLGNLLGGRDGRHQRAWRRGWNPGPAP